MTNELPNSIRQRRARARDVEIGRTGPLRLDQGLSQCGDGIGLTLQQMRKYEKERNRVSAARLRQIAELLDIPIMGARAKKHNTRNAGPTFVETMGAMRLLSAYADISSPTTKYALVILADCLRDKEQGRSRRAGRATSARAP